MSGTQNAYGTQPVNPFGGAVFTFGTGNGLSFGYTPSSAASSGVVSTDPNALAALQNSFTAQAANGLGEINAIGAAEYQASGSLFQSWGQSLANLSTEIANTFQQTANKSATACSGFFGCLF
jgi:hypothetical protein